MRAQLRLAQPPDKCAQIVIGQSGDIVPGDFKHELKLGKPTKAVNEGGTIGEIEEPEKTSGVEVDHYRWRRVDRSDAEQMEHGQCHETAVLVSI